VSAPLRSHLHFEKNDELQLLRFAVFACWHPWEFYAAMLVVYCQWHACSCWCLRQQGPSSSGSYPRLLRVSVHSRAKVASCMSVLP
jgi:hypothetical protein